MNALASSSRVALRCTCRPSLSRPAARNVSTTARTLAQVPARFGFWPTRSPPSVALVEEGSVREAAFPPAASSSLSDFTDSGSHRELKGKARAKAREDKGRERDRIETQRALEKAVQAGSVGTSPLAMRCTTLNREGKITITSRQLFTKLELCTRFGLQPRDLRKIDSKIANVMPVILVRREAILFSVLHLRVIITANEVTLFDTIGSEDTFLKGVFLYSLEHNLKTPTKAAHGLPYEFRALESCLVSVVSALEGELTMLRGLVVDLLDGLEETIQRDRLKLLLQYSRKLSTFQKRATLVQECLEELLEADDDLAAMYLTRRIANLGNHSAETEAHEEVELLLESFEKQTEEIVSEVDTLVSNTRATQDVVELILDSNRNELLALDLKVSIGTLGLTSGALVAGLFGMNLSTQIEEHAYAFPLISLSAFGLGAAITLIGLRKLRQMRRVGLSERKEIGMWGAKSPRLQGRRD